MRARLTLLVAGCLSFCACGYVGDPLPPALNIPRAVTDLNAVQRGSDLLVTFTAPAMTTEDLGIREFREMDLRVGPIPSEFSLDTWSSGAKQIIADLPNPGKPATVHLRAADWSGKEILVGVRFQSSRGRYSAWSNTVPLTVRAPLPKPQVKFQPDPEGIKLTWTAVAGAQYRITRRAEGETADTTAGTSAGSFFIDKAVTLGKKYTYTVQAFSSERNESEPSAEIEAVPVDIFPPAAPSGATATAGVNSIEIAWERNPEPDVASYRVYRATGNGEFSVLAADVEGIAFSDRQITRGTQYRYQLTATDRSGNESARSQILTATAP